MRYSNLIFQGGGVKGLSYAGALSVMPPDIQIRVVGGSSAGAIAAALIASGKDSRNLRPLLESLDVASLLGPEAGSALEELRDLERQAMQLFRHFRNGSIPWGRLIWFLTRNRRRLARLEAALSDHWGLFRLTHLKSWLGDMTGGIQFQNIKTTDCRIVAADVSSSQYRLFSKGETPGDYIHVAAAHSSTIPFFFKAEFNRGLLVDGGTLSNYPQFLVEREPFPTLGLHLKRFQPPTPDITTTAQFTRQLIGTMLDAHDKLRPPPQDYHEQAIYIPDSIGAVDFDLTQQQKDSLYQAGCAAALNLDWNRLSASRPSLTGLDPHPDKVVTRTLTNGQRLTDSLKSRKNQPEILHDDVTFHVRIEPDWSVNYELVHIFRVEGDRVLLGGATSLIFRAGSLDMARMSLADIHWESKETTGGHIVDLARFPAKNEVLERSFVSLFVPPVSKNDGERTFVTKWHIPHEMRSTLGIGEPDFVDYGRAPRADKHWLRLKFVIQAASSLGALKFTPTDGRFAVLESAGPVAIGNVVYREWTAGTAEFVELPSRVSFRIDIHTV